MNLLINKFVSFSLIQHIFNTIFFPYFIIILMSQRLSLELWGELIFIQAISALFIIFINMGIEFHGTKEIANMQSRNKDLIGKYNYLKLINIIFLFSIIFLMSYLINFDSKLILLAVLLSASIALSPSWIYLAEKNVLPIIKIEIFFRTIFIIFLFIFLKDDSLGKFYIFFLAINNLLISIFGHLFLYKYYSYKALKKTNYLKGVKSIFGLFSFQLSGISTMMLPIIILGFSSDYKSVAIFGNADKLFKGLRGIFSPITRIAITIFSRFKKNKYTNIMNTMVLVFLGGTCIISALILISDNLIVLLLGEKYYDSIKVFNILIISIPFIWTYNLLIGAYYIPQKKESFITKLNIFLLIICSIVISYIVLNYNILLLSFFIVFIEFVLFMFLVLKYFYRKKDAF